MGRKCSRWGKDCQLDDPITMNGVTMASVAALSRKVDKLSKQVKGAKA